jgi:hypothetical protein
MLAAAVRPWVRARTDGRERRLELRRPGHYGVTAAVRAEGGERTFRLGSIRVDGTTEWHSEVRSVRVRNYPTVFTVDTFGGPCQGHQFVIHSGEFDYPFSWGKPVLHCHLGELTVRYVPRSANERQYLEWHAKRAAERAANDSKAAA